MSALDVWPARTGTLSTTTGVYPIADARSRYMPGWRLAMVYRPCGLLVTVSCVPRRVMRTPWIGWLLSVPVMTPVILPVSPCADARDVGRRSAQADSKLTVMSRRFMVGHAPKRVEPAGDAR